jgi:ribosomal protein S18 acetylase RimI-like enzyme
MFLNQVSIRETLIEDTPIIAELLLQMGYPQNLGVLEKKIERLIEDNNEVFLVAEVNQQVCAFIAMHFVPQLAVEGDYARVSYFCVDEKYRSLKIGKTLLNHVENMARDRKCDRVELRSADYRKDAHRFYLNNDYIDSPKFFIKKFDYSSNE